VLGIGEAVNQAAWRRCTARLAVAGAVAASAVLMAAQAASANWLDQGTAPSVPGAKTWSFSAVSCPSPTTCMAVGSSDNSADRLLAETRNGTTWTVLTVPDPGGGTLDSVSCTSMSACTAVGSYTSGASTVTLAERWNGTSWSVQSTPNPGGATSSLLNRVSCPSATSCVAVGDSSSGANPSTLAEAWNGTSWTIQSTPNASGEASNRLNGLSCLSSSACTAAGSSSNGTSAQPLAEVWNGTNWTIQSTPNPSGSTFNALNAVSCTSASACVAVGNGFAEGWNGTNWSVQTIVSTKHDLLSVSCVSAANCTAVGSVYKQAIQFYVAESWNGTKWTLDNLPLSTSFDTDLLTDVSCQNSNSCTAVGSYHDPVNGYRPLAEVKQLRWQPQEAPVPTGAIATSIDSVSCASAKACMVVGNFEASGSVFSTFTESYSNGTWTIQPTPNATNSNLSGVSCTAATACTAVGDVFSGSTLVTLAERWNGTSWTVQSTPSPAGAPNSYLVSVSCTAATACTAAGFYIDGSGNHLPLAEAWNGTSWSIRSTPSPGGTTTTQFDSVSCSSASACVAVGYYLTPSYTMLAEVWNGTSWTIKNPSLPGGGSDGYLSGVSCSAATACTAVGDYFDGSRIVTLAERWNGTSWAAQTTPNRIDALDSYLAGVSCTSATSCTATGSVHHSGPVTLITLAEHWNGTTWHLEAPGAPAGALQSNLASVSCQSSSNCMGAGWYYDSSSNELPLVAPYN
jgi:hypothetical protein